jgi:hypothetical protein
VHSWQVPWYWTFHQVATSAVLAISASAAAIAATAGRQHLVPRIAALGLTAAASVSCVAAGAATNAEDDALPPWAAAAAAAGLALSVVVAEWALGWVCAAGGATMLGASAAHHLSFFPSVAPAAAVLLHVGLVDGVVLLFLAAAAVSGKRRAAAAASVRAGERAASFNAAAAAAASEFDKEEALKLQQLLVEVRRELRGSNRGSAMAVVQRSSGRSRRGSSMSGENSEVAGGVKAMGRESSTCDVEDWNQGEEVECLEQLLFQVFHQAATLCLHVFFFMPDIIAISIDCLHPFSFLHQ